MYQPSSFRGLESSADLALKLIALAARHLPTARSSTKTLGLIGFGADARELALRAQRGFGMEILVYNPTLVPQVDLDGTGAVQVPLSDLLQRSDVISLHCRARNAGPLMTGARLDQMKAEAVLINASDRALIDEGALAQSLMFDTITGAALAVAPGEGLHPMLAQCDTLLTLTASDRDQPKAHHRVA